MGRVFSRFTGGGTGGDYIVGDRLLRLGYVQPSKVNVDLTALGCFGRNRYIGGSDVDGISAVATGDFKLSPWLSFEIDNSNSQFTGFTDANGATMVIRVRFRLRVSDVAVSVTPKIYNETNSAFATVSGNSACNVTDPNYGDPTQNQVVLLTAPAGLKTFRPMVTIAGTVAPGLQVWATAMFDMFVNS